MSVRPTDASLTQMLTPLEEKLFAALHPSLPARRHENGSVPEVPHRRIGHWACEPAVAGGPAFLMREQPSTKMPRPVIPCFLALFSTLLCGVLEAQSQATTGVIRGLVRDPFRNPVAAAEIALRETRTNYERTLLSSSQGAFTAALLPLGSYDVTVRAPGWSEVRRSAVRVRVGQTVELTIALLPQMEEVVVEAAAPAVGVTRSGPATRLPGGGGGGAAQQRPQLPRPDAADPGGGDRPRAPTATS